MAGGVDYPFQTLNILTLVTPVGGSATVLIAAANPNRRSITIRNAGPTREIYIGFSTPLVDITAPVVLDGNQVWRIAPGDIVWTGAIYCIRSGAAATQNVVVTEFMY